MQCDSLKQYMEASGRTQLELADEVGISQPHLNQIIAGNRRPSPDVAAKLEKITGVPFRTILLPDEQKNETPVAPSSM